MILFIESTSLDMWEFIAIGDYIPMTEQLVPQEATDPEQPLPIIVRTTPRNEWTN